MTNVRRMITEQNGQNAVRTLRATSVVATLASAALAVTACGSSGTSANDEGASQATSSALATPGTLMNENVPITGGTYLETFTSIPGCGSDISVGDNQDAWITVCASATDPFAGGGLSISEYTGSSWLPRPGRATNVSINSQKVWASTEQGLLYTWNGSGWDQQAGCVTSVTAGPSNTAWATGCDALSGGGHTPLYYDGSSWRTLSGRVAQIAVSTSGVAWARTSLGDIYEWNGSSWGIMPGCATSIGVGPDGPWAIGCGADITAAGKPVFKWDGSSWLQVPSAAARSIAVSAQGVPWVLTAQGSIYIGTPGNGGGSPKAIPLTPLPTR